MPPPALRESGRPFHLQTPSGGPCSQARAWRSIRWNEDLACHNLINLYLRECAESGKRLTMKWANCIHVKRQRSASPGDRSREASRIGRNMPATRTLNSMNTQRCGQRAARPG